MVCAGTLNIQGKKGAGVRRHVDRVTRHSPRKRGGGNNHSSVSVYTQELGGSTIQRAHCLEAVAGHATAAPSRAQISLPVFQTFPWKIAI